MPKRRHPPYGINALAVAVTFAALEDAPYTQQYVERVLAACAIDGRDLFGIGTRFERGATRCRVKRGRSTTRRLS